MIEILLVAVLLYAGVILYSSTKTKYWYFTYVYKHNGTTCFGSAVNRSKFIFNIYDTIEHLERQGLGTPIIINCTRISKTEYNNFNNDLNEESNQEYDNY